LVQNTNQNLIFPGKNTLTHPICSVTSTGWNGCNLDPQPWSGDRGRSNTRSSDLEPFSWL